VSEELSGLRALVTGAASGIGLATAGALRAHGACVAGLDRTSGGDVPSVQADLADDGAVRAGVERAARLLGGIDILVNNAGVGAQGTVADNTDDEWRALFEVNVLGIVRACRAALPLLRESRHASIVNVCSIASTAGLPQRAAYSASKGAVLALTRAMAADHLGEGIRVNCVSPGTVDTPWVERLIGRGADAEARRRALVARQPHGRLVSADEVAAAIVFLAGPASGSTTGANLAVDGGMDGIRI
jgi:NAD(P)-dependent dehydrogenase (short-subunit alcohol dehydrogenase family)